MIKFFLLFAIITLKSPVTYSRLLPYTHNEVSTVELQRNDIYRLGDEWGKRPITEIELKSNPNFERMAKATGKVGSATGFFLGKFNNKLIMATNHHVCETENECLYSTVIFPLLNNLNAKIVEFYGSWSDIDLALFAIEVENQNAINTLIKVGRNFSFNTDVKNGEKLLTIGFGIAENPTRKMMANQDSDCVVFSKTAEYRFMSDPDRIHPGTYKAWSFANGCDISHGDSGSAMMDRENGNIIGIIWTGQIPKDPMVQSSIFLKNLLKNYNSKHVWEELSYAVPAIKMKEYINAEINAGKMQPEYVSTLKMLLNTNQKFYNFNQNSNQLKNRDRFQHR